MRQRYSRAVRRTAPRVAATRPGVAAEGYWLDEDRFYFLAERFDPALGRLVEVPSIAHAQAQRVEEGSPLHGVLEEAKPALERPALYSPDGRYACFIKGHDLWLKDRSSGAERPLTSDGATHHAYGQESESCLAVLSYRQRPYPIGLWSKDSQWLLTHRIDERGLPELTLVRHAPPEGGRPVLHRYKFPIPGDPMPMATYVAIHVPSGRRVSFDDFPAPVLAYSPLSSFYGMGWFDGEETGWFLRLDRYSWNADLICLDLARGTGRIVLSETVSEGYLEFHQSMVGKPNVRTLSDTGEVIWFSERDGWGHLYLYDAATGTLKNRITQGEWLVRDLVHVDEGTRKVLFTACGVDPATDPARRSVCSINLDGSGFEVLLAHDGDLALARTDPGGLPQDSPLYPSYVQPGVAPGGRFAAVRYSSFERGDVTQIVDLRSREGFPIASAPPVAGEAPARPFSALAADGVTRLHGVMCFPFDFDERRRYPLIDYIYPGPHVAHQPQSFTSMKVAFASALAELGFVTIMLDTRGMPFRSRALHQMGYGQFLEPQLADHDAVVRQLCAHHAFLDGDRIGIVGYSAGGAAAARALFDYGSTFKVGVSVCGNHDNDVFAAMWSDKYRGPGPGERWAEQANTTAAHRLDGKLLLISGDMDDNVPVSQTLALADALIRANRNFDLLIVPNEGHDLLMTNGYVQRRVWDYFVRHLLGETPPASFDLRFERHEVDQFEKSFWRELRW